MLDSSVPALAVRDLSVSISGHRILDSINFTIPQGQTTAIIGPNGAGKSVLLKAILRLIPKEKGDVLIFGERHERYRTVAPFISYIPQRFEIDETVPLTVRDLFSLKSRQRIGFTKVDVERMRHLLELVGMKDYSNAPLGTLSGGQLQRVLIGYSLMDTPRLLILDEPSAGIDIQGQETVYALLKRIQVETHLTMVLVSHELEIVMNYSEQVLCINRQLLCAGAPQKVLSNELLQSMYGMNVSHFSHTHGI